MIPVLEVPADDKALFKVKIFTNSGYHRHTLFLVL